jgi:hypothetical protein
MLTTDQAVTVIAEASCEHEAKCNGIGPSSRFVNRDHCRGVMRADAYGSLELCRLRQRDQLLGVRRPHCASRLVPSRLHVSRGEPLRDLNAFAHAH